MKWKWDGHVGRMEDNRWTILGGHHKKTEKETDIGGDGKMTFPNTKATGLLQLLTKMNENRCCRAISSSGLTWHYKVTR